MFHGHHRLPAEERWILNPVQFWSCSTVEHDVQPVIRLDALGRRVFIRTECNDANARPAFDFNESHFDKGLRIF